MQESEPVALSTSMPEAALEAGRETVRVLPPPPALRALVACAVLRSVTPSPTGRTPLRASVQPNPYACLNVVLAGSVTARGQPLPQRFLVGPLSAPLPTSVPGTLQSMSLVLQPWLMLQLCGIRAADLADRIVDIAQLDSPMLTAWCQHAAAPADALQSGDLSLWWARVAAALPQHPCPPALALDVLQTHGVEAAAVQCGCSSRQYRRRFRDHMGLAPAVWLRVTRWEQALQSMAAHPGAAATLAGVATEAGYADQAHMSRETRAFVGASPARLRRALHTGAASWALQPARVRFLQDDH